MHTPVHILLHLSHVMYTLKPRILDILILQGKTLFGALEASNIVCWLVNQPIAKLDLFKSPYCRWICETYVEYCYRNSATVRRLVQSPTLQSTISCGVHSDSRGKGIRVSPACWNYTRMYRRWPQNPGQGHNKIGCQLLFISSYLFRTQ